MSDPKDKGRPEELLSARQEFLQIFKRGAEFSEELLKENERLRFRLAEMESRKTASADEPLVREMMDKIQRLERERHELAERYRSVEAENRDFANRYVDIENENNNLLNIYVASYQLHSTLDLQEVLQIITEIGLNFLGAEVFGIFLLDDKGQHLRPVVQEGIEASKLEVVKQDEGVVGQVMKSAEAYFDKNAPSLQPSTIDPKHPLVCIPLRIKSRVIGVIALYKFLAQKPRLAAVDYELFTLLAGHAATAIFSAKLYTESKRKLNTIQGFIDLVTSS